MLLLLCLDHSRSSGFGRTQCIQVNTVWLPSMNRNLYAYCKHTCSNAVLILLYRSFSLSCLHKRSLKQKHVPDMAVMPHAVAEGGQPLVTSKSADTMHLQQQAVLDIASMCSGPEGCSLSVVLQCIAKGGLQVTVMPLLLVALSAGSMCLTLITSLQLKSTMDDVHLTHSVS